jgi:hypothetical protein
MVAIKCWEEQEPFILKCKKIVAPAGARDYSPELVQEINGHSWCKR